MKIAINLEIVTMSYKVFTAVSVAEQQFFENRKRELRWIHPEVVLTNLVAAEISHSLHERIQTWK